MAAMSGDMYRVVVTREDGHWLADVPSLEGAHTYARSLPTLDQAVREVVVLAADLPDEVGALYLVMRLARTAARDGVYTARAAGLVLILGWWLLAGGLVATMAEAFARVSLLGQLVTRNVDWGQWQWAWSVSWPVVFIGLGLIIFARVMRISAGMRADLEGTV